MPKAYWIAHIDVNEPDRYPEYVERARPAFERHGARFLARGGETRGMEGTARGRNVVIEFPSLDEAVACYESDEYRMARAVRQAVADGELLIVEGVE